jgi:RNA polymerase sigma factor (sigma-70 family)
MTAEDAKPVPVPVPESKAAAREIDWNAVYTDQLPRIYNYFRFRVGPAHDIEDLTSRTFEKAWRARGQYRSDLAGFSTWLFAIARNLATDQLRADSLRMRSAATPETVERTTPEDGVVHGSDLARLAMLTASLPERHRELIALKYGAALSNRVIARVTGLSESNVGTTLQRIVERLRAQW